MYSLAILLIGFSIFSTIVMVFAYFRKERLGRTVYSQWMGLVLLLALAGLQWVHFGYLEWGSGFIHSAAYPMLLFVVAPAFYLFSKPLLQGCEDFQIIQLLHLLPVLVAPFLPYTLALPMAFGLGAGYLLWLARSVYALRAQRHLFRLELATLGGVFLIAVAVMLLGVGMPLFPERLFFTLYACAIGCAFLLVAVALDLAPQLSVQVAEAARETYAVSTLGKVDCVAVLQKLKQLMEQDRLYQQPDLDLPKLAARLELSSHQLSELINTQLGQGFSRYLREYRVMAAKQMLLAEPSSSVLSVGLSVGFMSQSNFYQAFREITGMTPGQFRTLKKRSS